MVSLLASVGMLSWQRLSTTYEASLEPFPPLSATSSSLNFLSLTIPNPPHPLCLSLSVLLCPPKFYSIPVVGYRGAMCAPCILLLLWKLWILQSYSWKTRHGLTISGTLKQERLILISLQTLTRSFIYPFKEQLFTVTFLVTDSNRLLTQSLFFLFIKLPCNTQ